MQLTEAKRNKFTSPPIEQRKKLRYRPSNQWIKNVAFFSNDHGLGATLEHNRQSSCCDDQATALKRPLVLGRGSLHRPRASSQNSSDSGNRCIDTV